MSTRILLALLLALLLAACGGGGDEEEGETPTPSLDCQARPELCR
jgi:hypothetical protein